MSLSKESLNLVGSSGTILKLEQTSQWLTWKREMLDLLDMCGYGDLLTRNAQPPTEGNDLVTQIEAWRSRQNRACGAIRSRLGYNARVFTTGILTAQGMINHLETRYRPVGSAIFQELDRKYQDLTLESCDSVMEYANNPNPNPSFVKSGLNSWRWMKSARSGNHTLSTSPSANLAQTMKSSSLHSIRIITFFLSEIQTIVTSFSKRPLRSKRPSLPHLRKRTDKEEPLQGLHIEPWWPRAPYAVDTVEEKGMTSQLAGSFTPNSEESVAKLVTRDDNGKCRIERRTGRRRLMNWNPPRMRLLHTFNLIKLDWLSGKMTSKVTLD
jgi:hypothetical protein